MKKLFVLFILIMPMMPYAQPGLKEGSRLPNLAIKNIINYKTVTGSIKDLSSTLTVVDFFGTWCVPCIKALPHLTALQKTFGTDVNIVLVSVEKEEKLKNFIEKRRPFIFPVVVDEDNSFTNTFMPPSYPYTVVLDEEQRVVFKGEAAGLTDDTIKAMIKMNKTAAAENTIQSNDSVKPATMPMPTANAANNPLIELSQNFMYAAKTNEDASGFIDQLAKLSYTSLQQMIKTDDDKKAFWINLYNAYTSAALHKNPEQYKKRNKFFKQKNIVIAGKTFSLDKIEHGILRRSKIKWGLGYLNKIFPGKTEKQMRVDKVDYRIHFALNCGAKSCPPIAFYKSETINSQLDAATTAYLTGEAEYNAANNTLRLPALLSWFRGDFGGKKRIIELLKTKQLLPPNVKPAIRYKKYDWTLYLENYKQ